MQGAVKSDINDARLESEASLVQQLSTKKSLILDKENSTASILQQSQVKATKKSCKGKSFTKQRKKLIHFFESLPRTTILFLVISFIGVCGVFAFIIVQLTKRAQTDTVTYPEANHAEKLHIIIIEFISVLFYVYYVWDAIYRENSIELGAALFQAIAICARMYWFTYSQHIGYAWVFYLLVSVLLICIVSLAYLTYMHFGWRVYSKIQCDPRSKEGTERMRILFMQNRFTTFLKLDFQFTIIYFVVELLITMENSVASLQMWLSKAVLSQSILVLILLTPWSLLAYKTVKYANERLLRTLMVATPILSLMIPILSTIYVCLPGNFSQRPTNVTYILCLVLFIILRSLAFWMMFRNYRVLLEFQLRHGIQLFQKGKRKRLDFGPIDENNIQEILLPLVRGAWVIKKSSDSPRKRRFFQLSADGTTLRWAWNKYVYLFYITSIKRRPEKNQIIIKLGDYEPDLSLKFTDANTFEQWYEGLTYQHQSLLDPRGDGFAHTISNQQQLYRKQSSFLGNFKPNVSRRPQCRNDPNAENLDQILQIMKYAQDLAKQMNGEGNSPLHQSSGIENYENYNNNSINRALSNINYLQQSNTPQGTTWNSYFQQGRQRSQDVGIQNTLKRLIDTQQTFLNPSQQLQQQNQQDNVDNSNSKQTSFKHSDNENYNQVNINQSNLQHVNGQKHNEELNDQNLNQIQRKQSSILSTLFNWKSLNLKEQDNGQLDLKQQQQQQQQQQQIYQLQKQMQQQQQQIQVNKQQNFTQNKNNPFAQLQANNVGKLQMGMYNNGSQASEQKSSDEQFGMNWNRNYENSRTSQQHLLSSSHNSSAQDQGQGQVQGLSYAKSKHEYIMKQIAPGIVHPPQSLFLNSPKNQIQEETHTLAKSSSNITEQPKKVEEYQQQQAQQQLQSQKQLQQQYNQNLHSQFYNGWVQDGKVSPVWNDINGTQRNIKDLQRLPGSDMHQLQQGQQRFMVDFSELQFGKFLGRGGQGAVYAALYNDTPVAVKKTSHQEIFMHILSGSHDNIVAFRGWAADTEKDTYLIMEYCPRGTLDVMLHHTAFVWEIPKILQIVRNIARGMLHLHKRKILHRDLKPGNIFVSPGQVMKIGDFGQSRHLNLMSESKHTLQRGLSEGVIGTAQYTAPELYNESHAINHETMQDTLKADVYSFGITLFEILSRKRPFPDYDQYQIAYKWLVAPEEMALPTPVLQERESVSNRNIFNGLVRIMKQCCEINPCNRPSFEIITSELKQLMDNNRPEKKQKFIQKAFGNAPTSASYNDSDIFLNSKEYNSNSENVGSINNVKDIKLFSSDGKFLGARSKLHSSTNYSSKMYHSSDISNDKLNSDSYINRQKLLKNYQQTSERVPKTEQIRINLGDQFPSSKEKYHRIDNLRDNDCKRPQENTFNGSHLHYVQGIV